jgi:glutathione synthase/RimK-type ligase-like ATP-grasp enzyme
MKKLGMIYWQQYMGDDQPFIDSKRAETYGRYSEMLKDRGVELYVAGKDSYSDSGLDKAWEWNGEKWVGVDHVELDGIYDKFGYSPEDRHMLWKINEELPVLNHPRIEEVCSDKLETYRVFESFMPETRIATRSNAAEMFEDYSRVILKPRSANSGNGIEILESLDDFEVPENAEDWLLQRMLDVSGEPIGVEGTHDLRLLVVSGEVQQGSYVREPDEGELSNIAKGGSVKYVPQEEIPYRAMQLVEEITSDMTDFEPHIFSIDLMFDSDGEPWIVELNSKPGVGYSNVKEKEKELPKMNAIADALAEVVD